MTRNPYRIEGPACISFSGGRSSGYMLRQILDAHDGALPDDVAVLFANTGKEYEATLDFVRDVEQHWHVPIVWLEYREHETPAERWRIVDHATASRAGEPFEALITRRRYLPNPVTRFCTSELKVKAMHRYLIATRGWPAWTSVIGIRADEPRRVAKLSVPQRDRNERVAPMAEAGASKHDVAAFWRAQPFDLGLPNENGETYMGNCDLCFLKGAAKVMDIIRREPERAVWWARQEQRVSGVSGKPDGARFRKHRPTYETMHAAWTGSLQDLLHGQSPAELLAGLPGDELEDCECTD